MKILGIESSCDETAAALVENDTKVISNVIASSLELHTKTGGIIPEVAAREQLKYILPVIKEALQGREIVEVDALAVTVGPGLIGSLLVGVETAKTLSFVWQKPLISVNHLQAHLYANWLEGRTPVFPAIGLVVSGGHTDLVLIKDHHEFIRLGGTRDDAAGECFDKCARLLGLGYPGGPIIGKLAETGNPKRYPLPRPMISQDNYDFSFSGLKTAAFALMRREKKINPHDFAASLQAAIVEPLVEKTLRVAEDYQVKTILLAGGVSANQFLRQQFSQRIPLPELFIPSPKLCTDNGACIAANAFFSNKAVSWKGIQANPGLEIEEGV